MKKLVLKSALITIAVTVILAVSAVGLISFFSPVTMMRITASLGLESVSGDYAHEEYLRSGNLSYLAMAFEIAAEKGKDAKAGEYFDILYADEGFGALCEERDAEMEDSTTAYRAFICGQAACVRYRLAKTDEEKLDVIPFATSETAYDFPSGNPVIAITVEAVRAGDAAFCKAFYPFVEGGSFDKESETYQYIVKILKQTGGIQ